MIPYHGCFVLRLALALVLGIAACRSSASADEDLTLMIQRKGGQVFTDPESGKIIEHRYAFSLNLRNDHRLHTINLNFFLRLSAHLVSGVH